MNRRRLIRRVPKPRATKPEPLPAHAPAQPFTAQEMGAVFIRALTRIPPAYESGGHE
jgi:hypothetical protein